MRLRSFAFTLTLALALTMSATSLGAHAALAGGNSERSTADDVRVQGAGVRPQLFFACDSDTPSLQSLFSDPAIIENLRDLRAGVALALKDLSPARAQVVRQLNEAGIPMTAWMVVPTDQGYYLNIDSAPEADARFTAFEKWTADYGLKWVAVGLDIEPSLNEFSALKGHKLSLAATLLRHSFDGERVERAREAYSALIRRIQGDGYAAQTYQLLFLADERRVHSTVLERLFGVVDVTPDTPGWRDRVPAPLQVLNQEALMIYSGFNHKVGGAAVWKYGPDAQAIAVGSTAPSGDAATDAKFPPLNWDEFSRDLILASHFSRLVGVYSLEGCVRQGFLPRLKTLDWNQTVTISATSIRKMTHFRHAIEGALWIASHLLYLAGGALLIIAAFIRRRRAKKRRQATVGATSTLA